jgi:hypothetical protein
MKKKLSKSLSRIQKNQSDDSVKEDEIKKLSPYEISVFRSLKKKYDLSVISKNLEDDVSSSDELSEGAKVTLNRINKGINFVFKKK